MGGVCENRALTDSDPIKAFPFQVGSLQSPCSGDLEFELGEDPFPDEPLFVSV